MQPRGEQKLNDSVETTLNHVTKLRKNWANSFGQIKVFKIKRLKKNKKNEYYVKVKIYKQTAEIIKNTKNNDNVIKSQMNNLVGW